MVRLEWEETYSFEVYLLPDINELDEGGGGGTEERSQGGVKGKGLSDGFRFARWKDGTINIRKDERREFLSFSRGFWQYSRKLEGENIGKVIAFGIMQWHQEKPPRDFANVEREAERESNAGV